MTRFQSVIPAAIIAAIGLWVAYISFTQQPAQAFVFPRLISSLFVVLSLWTVFQGVIKPKGGSGISGREMLRLIPGIVIGCIYVFWAAKFFGFYTGTTLTVFILISLYDPAPHAAWWSWVKRVLITAGFIAVMYLLFGLLLNTFTPKEIFS